ncbi:MAG TPA: hypothetical protein VLQ52_07690, partial [Coriobacteriia bacterium]|nr:hypothetical protein [Coriobacteriia bacterium]
MLVRVATLSWTPTGTTFASLTPTYDLGSRVISSVLSGAVTASASTTYDDLDRPAQVTANGPEGTFTTQTAYDTAGRLVEHRAGKGAGPTTGSGVFDSRLSYDNRDRIGSVQLSGMELYTDTYTYDPAGRLATWARTGAGAVSATRAWDAAGNLTSKTQGTTTTAFASDADDRLQTATTGALVTTYTHDLLGRRTSAASPSGATTYAWNPLGQLTSVVGPQSTSVYSYGPSGMREKAVVTTGGTTKTTESVWEGGRVAAERDSD